MRAFEGQHSDNVAIKRTREQKQAQLVQLKEQLGALKSHAAPAIREAMAKRIKDLEEELSRPDAPARGDRPRGNGPRNGGPRPDGAARETRFPPRSRG